MADALYLSYWISGITPLNMLRPLERVLARFPFSQLAAEGPVLRVYGVSFSEAPVLETAFPKPPDPGAIAKAAREFQNADACMQVETFWDLWSWDGDWKLRPARVFLECYGPAFEDADRGETVRISFGLEDQFLPSPKSGGVAMVRANVQSLLRLVHDLDDALSAERRLLWPESGGNFAEKLEAALRQPD